MTDDSAAGVEARTPPAGAAPLAVLRPKIGWRLMLPPATGFFVAVMGVFRWARPMRAVDIEEVTLHYEAGFKDYPHRVLTLTCYDHRRWMEVSFRWWSRWWLVIRWLTTYCTRLEDGRHVWAVRTDGKTPTGSNRTPGRSLGSRTHQHRALACDGAQAGCRDPGADRRIRSRRVQLLA